MSTTGEVEQALRRRVAAGYPIVCFLTHEESRALEMVRSVVGAVPVWTATQGFDRVPDTTDPVRAIALAGVQPATRVTVMCDLHPFLRDPRVVRALREFAQRAEATSSAMFLVMPWIDMPVELEKDMTVLDVPLPDAGELARLLEAELERSGGKMGDVEAAVLAARGLTMGEARRAFRLAMTSPDMQSAVAEIVAEKQRIMRRSAALELVDPDVGLDEIGGLEVLKAWLRSRVPAFRSSARAFGLPQPRGVLVCGVQGCGKSLAAKAASKVFGLPLVRMDFAAVFASSSPELAIRTATRIAEAVAPVVLWVDEIEKGLAADASGTHARVFGEFLVWMQEKRAAVFVAATANEVEQLPPELVRRGRFDDVFFVDLPGVKEREEILAIHLRRHGRDPGKYPIAELTKGLEHFSGAELEQVVIGALFRAFGLSRDLVAEDLRIAAKETVPLASMYEERVQALRAWAATRARRASADRPTLELFED